MAGEQINDEDAWWWREGLTVAAHRWSNFQSHSHYLVIINCTRCHSVLDLFYLLSITDDIPGARAPQSNGKSHSIGPFTHRNSNRAIGLNVMFRQVNPIYGRVRAFVILLQAPTAQHVRSKLLGSCNVPSSIHMAFTKFPLPGMALSYFPRCINDHELYKVHGRRGSHQNVFSADYSISI